MKRLTRSRLWAGNGVTRACSFTLGKGHVAVTCATGPVTAHGNQDAAAAVPLGPETTVLMVADGIGGEARGDVVSRFAVEMVRLYTELLYDSPETLGRLIVSALSQANREIVQSTHLGGTTAVVALVHAQTLQIFHAGDSRGLVTGQGGKIVFQTLDHTVTQDKIDAGLIQAEDAMRDLHRHLLTNALGDPGMELECSETIPISPETTVLLATDGLTDNLPLDRIVELTRGRGLTGVVDGLVQEACAHMVTTDTGDGLQPKPDNITVLAYRPSRQPSAASRSSAGAPDDTRDHDRGS